MTVYIHHELSCDESDCFRAYAASVDEVNSLARTRRGARRAGWTALYGKDYCPEHATRPVGGEGRTDAE